MVIEDLNGDRHPQTINVVLLAMPTGAGGRPPTTSADVQQFIQRQIQRRVWSEDEAGAVYATMRTVAYLKRQTRRGILSIRQNAEFMLGGIGISPDLVVA
jgi:hypothetical protein